MTPGEAVGLVGGVVGSVVGIAGGIVGTWFCITRTEGPRERAFVIRAAAVCWFAGLVLLALLFLLPDPWQWLLWIPYAILLPLGVRYANRQQQRIRLEESREKAARTGKDHGPLQAERP